tara:strand:- start:440 stop:700 length:261 start_codon:yes stop_codon:yes gene_type:complete
MKKHLLYLSVVLITAGCGNDEPEVVEQPGKPQPPKKKYRTYKRVAPMMKSDRMNLERASDLEDARRYILKTFDSYQSDIPSVSNSK